MPQVTWPYISPGTRGARLPVRAADQVRCVTLDNPVRRATAGRGTTEVLMAPASSRPGARAIRRTRHREVGTAPGPAHLYRRLLADPRPALLLTTW
jgi:hypothetical protein